MVVKKNIYLFANWKMYLDFAESNILAHQLAAAAKKLASNLTLAVFPSALSLYTVGQVLNDVKIQVGAQNVYWQDKGGFTGEISAEMFREAGCSLALVGHSERRHLFHETDHEVRQKMEAALGAGLTAVLCVGETQKQRDAGDTAEVLEIQLRSALQKLSWPKKQKLIVAYEPVWAIGTGNNCDPKEAEKWHVKIKKIVSTLLPKTEAIILYGGSVRPENVAGYLQEPDIDGCLIGGASANWESLHKIIQAASK